MAKIEGLAEITKALIDLVPNGNEIQSAFKSSGDRILMQIKSDKTLRS